MGKKNTDIDVTIIGGGPAGLSALLWCADLGLNASLLEREPEVGGQLLLTHNTIQNYLGVETPDGRALRDIFVRQLKKAKPGWLCGAEIVDANLARKTLTLADGSVYSSRSIIIATGVRRRKLNVPGENEFRGSGILSSGKLAVSEMAGKTVVIVGGGDAALENALILKDSARRIIIVHRRSQFSARTEFLGPAREADNTEFRFNSQITKIIGGENVEAVELKELLSGKLSMVETTAVLIRIGVEPNTEMFRGQIELDDAGYIKIDANCATNLPGIFAVGDVANRSAPTVAAATGHGSIAAKAILQKLDS